MSTYNLLQLNDPVFTLSRQLSAMEKPPIFSGIFEGSGCFGIISGRKWGFGGGDLSLRWAVDLSSCFLGGGDKSFLGRGADTQRLVGGQTGIDGRDSVLLNSFVDFFETLLDLRQLTGPIFTDWGRGPYNDALGALGIFCGVFGFFKFSTIFSISSLTLAVSCLKI